jgi:hypothetical protein
MGIPLQASGALELLNTHLGRAALGSAIAGGGALAYNAFSQPEYQMNSRGKVVMDKDGNPVVISENDINPFLAAGAGAGLGAASMYAPQAMNAIGQQAMRPVNALRRKVGVTEYVDPYESGRNWPVREIPIEDGYSDPEYAYAMAMRGQQAKQIPIY